MTSNKGEETMEAIKRMGTKVFEIITTVRTVDTETGGVFGIDFGKLLNPYKGKKIRIVIEQLNEPKKEVIEKDGV